MRPGTILGNAVRIGNFVETKKAVFEDGAKANHLSYIGDAQVGAKANIGAGTITCNYDGYDKFKTEIGEGAFIGSNTALVAPVTIGDGAIIGAGSTITKSVLPDDLSLTRAPQKTLGGGGISFRNKKEGKRPMMFDAPKAASLLDAMCHKSVLVIGDLMLDRFIDGQVERISPEAPVPVLSKATTMAMPGGAANVARNLCHLGVKTILTGITGQDDAGRALADELSAVAGLLYQPVMDKVRPTTTKTRFRAGAQQILRVDDEVKDDIAPDLEAALLDIVETHLPQCDIVVLSDYAKGCLTATLTQAIIKLAKSHQKQVIADPKSHDFGKYQAPHY